jgi:hypothetical protein
VPPFGQDAEHPGHVPALHRVGALLDYVQADPRSRSSTLGSRPGGPGGLRRLPPDTDTRFAASPP